MQSTGDNKSGGTPAAASTGGTTPTPSAGTPANSITAKTEVSPTQKPTLDVTKVPYKDNGTVYSAYSADSPSAYRLAPGVAEGQETRKAFDASNSNLEKTSLLLNLYVFPLISSIGVGEQLSNKGGGVPIETNAPKIEQKPNGYKFEQNGLTYSAQKSQVKNGDTEISHTVSDGKNTYRTGFSYLEKNGTLSNMFEVPSKLQGQGISKAMYKTANELNPTSIEGAYYPGSDNYIEFMKVFNFNSPTAENFTNAIMATPAAKATPSNYKLTFANVDMEGGKITKISVTWSNINFYKK